MVKVCHLTSVHKRYDTRIYQKMCRSLAANGYDVTLLVMDDLPEEVKDGVKIIPVPFCPQNRVDRILNSGKKLFKKAFELDCDLYHFHDPELLSVGLKLKKYGKKVIYDSHEDYPGQILGKEWIPSIFRRPLSFFFSWYESFVAKRLDGVITVAEISKERLSPKVNHLQMIYNYPELISLPDDITKEKNTVIYAGGISSQWSHEVILKALEHLEDVKYNLLGSGSKSYMEKLSMCPAWNKTFFAGQVPHREVFNFMNRSQVGLAILQYSANTMGKHGTLGNTKLFEYMRMGLPVICTGFDLWKPIIQKWECGICVNPDSVEEIADAINYLFSHPEEAKEMGRNGRKAVEEEFNWDVECEKLLELYAVIINKKNQGK